ncbi:unnamed protein product [Onchocerca ochengi]|uniref:Uncharacterized protein n=1 Tax=Onchocerca ochengi TaxID=42157 RepID=A0A182EE64_ONCOC|nr:unnamed protein product [Onchocerca ochengi]
MNEKCLSRRLVCRRRRRRRRYRHREKSVRRRTRWRQCGKVGEGELLSSLAAAVAVNCYCCGSGHKMQNSAFCAALATSTCCAAAF